MTYKGTILDATSERPLPFASVTLYRGSSYMTGKAADRQGYFEITTSDPAERITISAAGYKTWNFPASIYQNKFELERSGEILSPVVVTASTKKNQLHWLLLGSIFLLAMKKDKKEKMGKIETQHIILIGMAVAGIFGFKAISKMLEKLGIFKSQDTKDLDNAMTNPNSPWSPNFWKHGPAGMLGLRKEEAESRARQIKGYAGAFNDNEELVINIFRKLETQSQVSMLSEAFQQLYNKDLLTFLRGGSWWMFWADGLSEGELSQLNKMVLNKPKYFK